jgi:hypothetical protein
MQLELSVKSGHGLTNEEKILKKNEKLFESE